MEDEAVSKSQALKQRRISVPFWDFGGQPEG
jgi:hypothetical protein